MYSNMWTLDGLKKAILDNDYNLPDALKRHLVAASSSGASGIVRRGGRSLYYYIVRPWLLCPSGRVEVEYA